MKSRITILSPVLALVSLGASGCSNDRSGGSGNAAPGLAFTAPMSAVVVDVGQPVELRWVAEDPDDTATTTVTAIGLDVARSLELVGDVPESDGAEQSFLWTPAAGDEGTYLIQAAITDGDRTTYADAPGTVRVGVPVPSAAGAAAICSGGQVVASDSCPDGSFIVAGVVYAGTDALFDAGGPGETLLSTETYDAFVARYAPDGALLWVRQTHALSLTDGQVDSLAYPWDVVALPDGGCVVDLAYQGTVTVGAGTPGEATWSTTLERSRELLVAYDAAGGVRWSRPVYDADPYVGTQNASLHLAGEDTLVLAAERGGELVFDLGGSGETILSEDTSFAYLAGFATDGSFLFATDVAQDPAGGLEELRMHADETCIWLAGLFGETVTFGAGHPEETTLSALSSENEDQFLACFDVDGGLRWARHLAGVSAEEERDELLTAGIAADANGAVYVLGGPLEEAEYVYEPGGVAETTVTVGNDEEVLVLARYEADGTLSWLRTLTSETFEESSLSGPVVLGNGDVALAARFEELVAGDGLLLEAEVAPGRGSLLLARFDATGSLAWALNDGGEEDDGEPASLTALGGDRLLLTGRVASLDGVLELGTNEAETTFLQADGTTGFSFRAIYAGDGSF